MLCYREYRLLENLLSIIIDLSIIKESKAQQMKVNCFESSKDFAFYFRIFAIFCLTPKNFSSSTTYSMEEYSLIEKLQLVTTRSNAIDTSFYNKIYRCWLGRLLLTFILANIDTILISIVNYFNSFCFIKLSSLHFTPNVVPHRWPLRLNNSIFISNNNYLARSALHSGRSFELLMLQMK